MCGEEGGTESDIGESQGGGGTPRESDILE